MGDIEGYIAVSIIVKFMASPKRAEFQLGLSWRPTAFCVRQKMRIIQKNAKVEFSPKIVFIG